MKSGDDLVALLGKPSEDDDVVDALAQFAIRWPPELDPTDEPPEDRDWYVWRPSSPMGFEFGFQDEAHLKALPVVWRGRSPLVLSSVTFYGEHEGVRPYRGVLPFGLALADSRATVRKKLSVFEVAPRSHRRDVWDAPRFRVVVEHVPGRDVIDSVLVGLRLTDWPPPADPPAALPTVKEIIKLFGLLWYAPEVRKVFVPLGLDDCGPDIATQRHADLRRACGLELYFFRDPARDRDSPMKNKGAVFSGVVYFHPRCQEARGWAGELPLGLSFDLAYPDFVKVIGRSPDDRRDEPLSGYAVWHFPQFTLHLLYDNIDNVILCVSLFQPGTWERMGR